MDTKFHTLRNAWSSHTVHLLSYPCLHLRNISTSSIAPFVKVEQLLLSSISITILLATNISLHLSSSAPPIMLYKLDRTHFLLHRLYLCFHLSTSAINGYKFLLGIKDSAYSSQYPEVPTFTVLVMIKFCLTCIFSSQSYEAYQVSVSYISLTPR